jgi:hypothetical protein
LNRPLLLTPLIGAGKCHEKLMPFWRSIVNEFEQSAPVPTVDITPAMPPVTVDSPVETSSHPVDPVRSAAGRLGGKRVHELVELGREFEKEHGLKAGRQRLKQLVQLGRRYEMEHGLRAPTPRRKRKGDAWQEFLTALSRVVKPAHRPAVEQLVAALRPSPRPTAVDSPVHEQAA